MGRLDRRTLEEESTGGVPLRRDSGDGELSPWRPPDLRRALQLALATLWLVDGLLQLQPSFFQAGGPGLSGMLAHNADGSPGWVAQSVTWNASVVNHHAPLTNALFAAIQILLGLGIAWRPTTRSALAVSVPWALLVWWFGESVGGLFHGALASPLAGGPGAVLFYALLAVLLWPVGSNGSRRPSASDGDVTAAGLIGRRAAKIVWLVVWSGLAVLELVTAHRSGAPRAVIGAVDTGEPGWLATLDRHSLSLVGNRGLVIAVILAAVFVLVGLSVLLPRPWARAGVVVAVVTAAVIWVVGQNFGTIFPGGATDPNSGPLIALFALSYWPPRLGARRVASTSAPQPVLAGVG